jgi:hypothetical protein
VSSFVFKLTTSILLTGASSVERYAEGSGVDERSALAPGLLHTAQQASVKPAGAKP